MGEDKEWVGELLELEPAHARCYADSGYSLFFGGRRAEANFFRNSERSC